MMVTLIITMMKIVTMSIKVEKNDDRDSDEEDKCYDDDCTDNNIIMMTMSKNDNCFNGYRIYIKR